MNVLSKTILCIAIAGLAGCATVDINRSIEQANVRTDSLTDGKVTLALTDEQKQALKEKAEKLLFAELNMQGSVQLMLCNSPDFQALLLQNWANQAAAGQTGRIPNPVFNFERITVDSELELGRLFTFGLLDLITLPWKQQSAALKIEQAQLKMTSEIVDQSIAVQKAWIDAVHAKQKETYALKVLNTAQAGAELAKRLEEIGNFTAMQRIRQQLFYSDAIVTYALSKQASISAKEKLGRLLGLTTPQMTELKLPDRLPELPKDPMQPEQASKLAVKRLDVEIARLSYDAALKRSGVDAVGSFVDVELGLRRNSIHNRATDEITNPKGFELDIRLPLFDWGGLKREALTADLLTKGNQLEATIRNAESTLRESYFGYRTAYDIARHFQEDVVPMQEALSRESALQYNGMLIGTFELLSENRNRVQAVQTAIDAQANFLKSRLVLESTLIGRPQASGLMAVTTSTASAAGGH